MKHIEELIRQHGLEEDPEHVIIPFIDKSGGRKRCYLLKRRFIRIVYAEGYSVDYPLSDAIEATIKYPERLLSEALSLMYKETAAGTDAMKSGLLNSIYIRRMESGEEQEVSSVIQEVFSEFISPLYSEQGRREFLQYIEPESIRARAESNYIVYVAEDVTQNKIIGMIEIKNFSQISLLFVERSYQYKGIGRSLLNKAKELCRGRSVHKITVNSSPNAVRAYQAYGFKVLGEEKEINGIRYVPMNLLISG